MAQKLLGVFFQVNSNDCSSTQSISFRVWLYLIRGGIRSPDPLSLVIVGLGDDNDLRACQESGVEPNTELSDEIDVTSLEGFEEVGGA